MQAFLRATVLNFFSDLVEEVLEAWDHQIASH